MVQGYLRMIQVLRLMGKPDAAWKICKRGLAKVPKVDRGRDVPFFNQF